MNHLQVAERSQVVVTIIARKIKMFLCRGARYPATPRKRPWRLNLFSATTKSFRRTVIAVSIAAPRRTSSIDTASTRTTTRKWTTPTSTSLASSSRRRRRQTSTTPAIRGCDGWKRPRRKSTTSDLFCLYWRDWLQNIALIQQFYHKYL